MNLYFKKQKPYSQKTCEQEMIVGGVVRGDVNKLILENVKSRDTANIVEAVRRRVSPGYIVHSD